MLCSASFLLLFGHCGRDLYLTTPTLRPLKRTYLRSRYLLAIDALSLTTSVALAYWLRFDGQPVPPSLLHTAYLFAAFVVPLKLAIFLPIGLYRRIWRFASIADLERILTGLALAAVAAVLVGGVILPATGLAATRVPLSILALDSLLSGVLIGIPRLTPRIVAWHGQRRYRGDDMRAIIAGAGAAGQMIAKELITNPALGIRPVAFVDDDRRKAKHRLHELPVLGTIAELGHVAKEQQARLVVIAMPSAPGAVIRRIVRAAADNGVKTRTVPSLSEMLAGKRPNLSLRDVQIEDLLRREPVETDLASVRNLSHGRTVMVTGAGGSIGSELCRQLARLTPARLVLLGHGENSIFDIQCELRTKFPNLTVTPVIADVRDRTRIMAIFEDVRPYAVFHAAAHKHVPLMEENVVEAITNNIQGTKNVVDAAIAHGVEQLVLISTDKAVRPTSMMGATKRLAERVVQHGAASSGRNFVSVRFGNVLGSRGSVVPTFMQQIRAGGPVTITHPDMRRYFMTIPEAVQLVLQAGALGNGGEVFVLDMGEPVRILDLATDLIGLCGLEVERDIEIKVTGTRPGEKLYEEMFFHEEHASQTDHPKVLRAKKAGLPDGLVKLIDRLIAAAPTVDHAELREMLIALVPDFQRPAIELADVPQTDIPQPRRWTGQFRVVSGTPAILADSATDPDM